MSRRIVHVIGTGTIGEPLIGLLCNFKNDLGIDDKNFSIETLQDVFKTNAAININIVEPDLVLRKLVLANECNV